MVKAKSGAARRRGRGRPASFSREQILETGLQLVRREGRDGLTMRAVADELGTGPMSLYTHVRGKDDLLEGMALLVFEGLDLGLGVEGSWQEQLSAWMGSMRDQLLEYPELVELAGRQQYGSPLLLGTCSAVAAVLADAGLDDADAVEAAQGLIWSAIGFVLLDAGSTQAATKEAPEVQLASALFAIAPEERASIEHLVPFIATRRFDSLYESLVQNIIGGIEKRLEGGRS
jgi:TetR/AcrR family tetracycline transcriptional repressor